MAEAEKTKFLLGNNGVVSICGLWRSRFLPLEQPARGYRFFL